MTQKPNILPRLKSWDDARFQAIRALNSRKERDRTGHFFAEGLRFVGQAAALSAEIESVVIVPKTLDHPYGLKLRRQLEQNGVPIWEITPELFGQLSRTEEPQWIGAVIKQCWSLPAQITTLSGLCWIALDQVQSPGNLGTILRTGDAVGASGLILIGDSVDPYDPGCVRATLGAIFAQRLVRVSASEFAAEKSRQGWQLVGTSPHADTDYRTASYAAPTVLFMGGEKRGLSEERLRLCDTVVKIPMVGRSDSLNLAIATSLMLYEVFRQRPVPAR